MEFKSKFNVGDTIHFMSGKFPLSQQIKGVNIFIGERRLETRNILTDNLYQKTKEDQYSIEYYIEDNSRPLSENDVFTSREELKNSVFPD